MQLSTAVFCTGLASKKFVAIGLMKLGERSPNPLRTLEMDE